MPLFRKPDRRQEILKQLDECNKNFNFPMFGNTNIDHLCGRLSCFRNESSWAILFNWVVWWPGTAEGLIAMCECYGNCVRGGLGFQNSRTHTAASLEYGEENDDGCADVIGVTINKKRFSLSDLQLDCEAQLQPDGQPFAVVLALSMKYKEELLVPETKIALWLPSDIQEILRLESWYHPITADGAIPSRSQTMQSIADVLVSGDASLYRPTLKPNSDWASRVLCG